MADTRIKKLMALLEIAHPNAKCALKHSDPFQLIAATILSAQCTDERVNRTTPALFARFPDAASLAEADITELEAVIRPLGFFRNKARSLIGMASALARHYDGKVPCDPVALGELPGVGRKTANVVLANGFGVPALAVDTHIFRVARRLGLSEAVTPEKVETNLCALFPKDSWIALHHQLIWHGRLICSARNPRCPECTLIKVCAMGTGAITDPHRKK
jgi:endonuclease-3